MLILENCVIGRPSFPPLLTIPSLQWTESGLILLLGRNGSGKSSLIRTLLGLQAPLSGIVGWLPSVRDHLVYLPESLPDFGRLRVSHWLSCLSGVLDFSPRACPKSYEIRQRTARWISKGQSQRFFLEVLLATQPKVMVLDEPYSGLDPWAQSELNDDLYDYLTKGGSILMSTHAQPDDRLLSQARATWVIEKKTLHLYPGSWIQEFFHKVGQ